ncbi:MAG: ROK family protein, partial [Acidobacteria bacterium]|nr:ROK family protein [Acidobacteriota bacterium]
MRIGVDVGGTKLEAIALTPSGEELTRTRIAAPRGDYRHTVDAIAELVERVERDAGQTGTVGVGMPGTISPATGLVKNANSTWLNGHPLGRDLPIRLSRPVRFANDANCFALSESADGAAAGVRNVFGAILGTGTGGGLVIDGQVVVGANAVAGEWGHTPLPWPRPGEWPGEACYCGRTGCLETFLSGPGLARDFELTANKKEAPEAIVALANAGDLAAVSCLQRYENRLARALAVVINILDPDVIVLGGGLSNVERLYT